MSLASHESRISQISHEFMPDDPPSVKCAQCLGALETFEEIIPFTDLEDVVIVRCKRCKSMIYARRESRMVQRAKWKGTA